MRGKISISTVVFQRELGDFAALEAAKDVGAEAVDISLADEDYRKDDSVFSNGDEAICEYYTKLKKKADELGIQIGQTHGFNPPVKGEDNEYNTVVVPENSRLNCMATAILGAPVCVFHPAGTMANQGASDEFMFNKTYDYIKTVLEYAKKYGVKFGLETVGSNYKLNNTIDFFGDFNKYMDIYSRVDAIDEYKGHFTSCVDSGHTNMAVQFGMPTVGDAIRKMGKNVGALHLHDNNGLIDQHTIIGRGTVDWHDVFDALYEVGYSGNYNSETYFSYKDSDFRIEEARYTVNVIKKLLSRYSFN
ncbi:MAG: sugar phosphate isomerase/epimerase [Clostridia bacterium]|nr:sugar phosphate isomerase/epimerase [Clostridia bacterium]